MSVFLFPHLDTKVQCKTVPKAGRGASLIHKNMGFFGKGYKDGNNKKDKPPKSDGLFGTPIFQSDKNKNQQKAYTNGQNAGNKNANAI